ncbi:sugar transferase [Flavobacterium sp. RHBU_3]|uniref:sugar transferase n=1 Tax=Flavobacterium sp. RHBU_3 TaxID=3391184 RepID=UPI0039846795
MVKRVFDIVLAAAGLMLCSGIIVLFFILITSITGENGIFIQMRVGRYGKLFRIYKLRSMKDTQNGKEVTTVGKFMRRYKIDELPQLYNILIGDMSFVGPRPDLPGYYDKLQGDDRELLLLRPGLTGPASIKYANEEAILAVAENPQYLNDYVIFPDKVRINRNYQKHQSLWLDVKLIVYTVLGKMPGEEYLQ